MGLDNIPDPYPCAGKETTIRTKDDRLDCEAMRVKGICPVAIYNHTTGMFGTYCWLRGKIIANELEALGYSYLEEEFYSNKSPDEIEPLLEEVKSAYEEFKKLNKEKGNARKGAERLKSYKNGKLNCVLYSTYEEIKSAFEDTIKWLEMLQNNECGFKAWY